MQEKTEIQQIVAEATNDEIEDILRAIGKRWQKKEHKYFNGLGHPFNKNRNDCFDIPCSDHWCPMKINDEKMCTMEPYQSSMVEVKALISFCEKHDLTFMIDGESAHFPGMTYRIIVKELDMDDEFTSTPSELTSIYEK